MLVDSHEILLLLFLEFNLFSLVRSQIMSLTGVAVRRKREEIGLSQAKLSELSNIPQHILSAFELEKSTISRNDLASIKTVLDGISTSEVRAIKKKRYQNHSFEGFDRDHSRYAKVRRTEENGKYVSLIKGLEKARASTEKTGKVISLFSGCGGFSLGFSWAGFEVLGFLELEDSFRKIYRNNFPLNFELGSDINEVDDEAIQAWKSGFGEIDVIIGGPPCQGFSLSGKRDTSDSRNSLFRHYLRVVRGLSPKVAIMENVKLLTSMKGSDGKLVLDHIYEDFERSGYKVRHFEINAKEYGVPQHRERVIFVATRADLDLQPSLPWPTHGVSANLFSTLSPFRTFGDACSDLDFLESGERSAIDRFHEAVKHPDHVINWLWNVPEGKSAHDNEDERLRPPSGYNTTYKRQIWNEPASTVQTTFGMISGCRNVHPISTRSLTIREAARIQSFPDSYQFVGTLGNIRNTIGNAVPPLLAFVIANHVRKEFLNLIEVASL